MNEKKKSFYEETVETQNQHQLSTVTNQKPITSTPKINHRQKKKKKINKHGRPKQSRSRTLTWNLREAPPNLRSHRFARLCDLSPRNRAALGRLRSDIGCREAHEQPPRQVLDSPTRLPIG